MEAVAASRLSNILMDYHDRYPNVVIEVSTNPTGTLIDQTLMGELDLSLVADLYVDPRLEITPIFVENLVLVSDKRLVTFQTPTDLGANPTLIGFSSRCAYRTRLTEWVKQSNLSARVIEINSYHALLNCIAAGMGVGLIPEVLLEQYPFKDNLRIHQLPIHLRETITCAIWRKDSIKPSLKAFVDELIKARNVESTLLSAG